MLLVILILAFPCYYNAVVSSYGFVATVQWKVRPIMISHQRTTTWAKPPPSSLFDLHAIEAFESELTVSPSEIEVDHDNNNDNDDIVYQMDKQDDSTTRLFEISSQLSGKRIDAVLALLLESELLSRSFCGSLLSDGHVAILETKQKHISEKKELDVVTTRTIIQKKSFKVASGQWLEVRIPPAAVPTDIIAQDIPLDILYEDQHMIVLNKAKNMVVHPAAGNWDGTIVNALAFYLTQKSTHGSGDFYQMNGPASLLSKDETVPFVQVLCIDLIKEQRVCWLWRKHVPHTLHCRHPLPCAK